MDKTNKDKLITAIGRETFSVRLLPQVRKNIMTYPRNHVARRIEKLYKSPYQPSQKETGIRSDARGEGET